jgi:hypothetical protein
VGGDVVMLDWKKTKKWDFCTRELCNRTYSFFSSFQSHHLSIVIVSPQGVRLVTSSAPEYTSVFHALHYHATQVAVAVLAVFLGVTVGVAVTENYCLHA